MFNSPLKDICIFGAVALIASAIAVYCQYKYMQKHKEGIDAMWQALKK